MPSIIIKDYDFFKELLIKGAIFILSKFKFSNTGEEKARWILILNNTIPIHKKAKIYWVPLTSNIDRALQDTLGNTGIGIIKNSVLKRVSLFDLSFIRNNQARILYTQYRLGKLKYKDKLCSSSISYLNQEIRKFLNDPQKSKTIPPKLKKVIS